MISMIGTLQTGQRACCLWIWSKHSQQQAACPQGTHAASCVREQPGVLHCAIMLRAMV
eukprot:COSAG06_NODE_67199_length_252_cov_1.019608_1_plen_57_part_01